MEESPFSAVWTCAAVALKAREPVVAPLNVRVKLPATPLTVNLCGFMVRIVGAEGFALIGRVPVFEAAQPAAFVTTSRRPTLPEEPAVDVIGWMFVALGIGPFE